MSDWQEQPRIGQGVWCDEYKNGIIVSIGYEDQVADVKWYNSGKVTEVELDYFFGCYNFNLKQWVLQI